MKKKNNKKAPLPKYELGTLIESPSTALAENEIAMARARMKASNNGWVKGLKIFGNLAQQVGTSMMNKGAANGEGADGKGVAGFLNNNNGTMNSLFGMMSATGNTGGFAFGGDIPGLTPVEVEGEEVGQTPDGQLLDFIGPSHEQGGIDIALPPGTEMYSKRVKVDGVSMADRKKKREKKTMSLEDLLSKNPKDSLVMNALGRTMATNETEEIADNKIQETVKAILEPPTQTHAYGSTVLGGEDPTNPYGIKFAKGFDYSMFKSYLDKYSTSSNNGNPVAWNTDDIKTIQQYVGADPDGILGKDSLAKMKAKFDTTPSTPTIDKGAIDSLFGNMPLSDSASLNDTNRPFLATPGIVADGNRNASPGNYNSWDIDNNSVPDTIQQADGNPLMRGAEGDSTGEDNPAAKSGFSLDSITGGATFGDILGMAGNWYQSDKIMKLIEQNRAGDTPNINAFKDYGKEGLKSLDKTKQYVNQVRDKVLKDLELSRGSSAKRNRNSARGVNTQRALDLATDAQINDAQEKSYATFAEQMMNILGNEANMKNNIDSVVMQGEQARDLADRQDRDNYFSQLITGHKNKGKVISETGRNPNQIKERNVMENLINQLSAYGITVDKNGNLKKGK